MATRIYSTKVMYMGSIFQEYASEVLETALHFGGRVEFFPLKGTSCLGVKAIFESEHLRKMFADKICFYVRRHETA